MHTAWVTQRSGRLALAGLAVMLASTAAGLWFSRANANLIAEDRVLLVAFMSLPLVGLLVVWRRPTNGVGWVLAAAGVLAGLYLLLHGWAIYGLRTEPGSLPFSSAAGWIATWLVVPAIGLLPFVAATFPAGRIERPSVRRDIEP